MFIRQVHNFNDYDVHVAIKHRDPTSLLRFGNVDYVKNMHVSEVMSLCVVKSDLYSILTNREFRKGGMPFDYYNNIIF